jgi:hypothetical protein
MTTTQEFVWQDREIIFDAKPQQLQCRRGEVAIDSINSVEDTKGSLPLVVYLMAMLSRE